jgi:hypothetical protein
MAWLELPFENEPTVKFGGDSNRAEGDAYGGLRWTDHGVVVTGRSGRGEMPARCVVPMGLKTPDSPADGASTTCAAGLMGRDPAMRSFSTAPEVTIADDELASPGINRIATTPHASAAADSCTIDEHRVVGNGTGPGTSPWGGWPAPLRPNIG